MVETHPENGRLQMWIPPGRKKTKKEIQDVLAQRGMEGHWMNHDDDMKSEDVSDVKKPINTYIHSPCMHAYIHTCHFQQ
jgi:hypothetical protein